MVKVKTVRFLVLTAATIKITICLDAVPSSPIEII
jgi:hypothetical protein